MRDVTIKTIVRGERVFTMLGQPTEQLGDNYDASLQVRRIKNVPDSVSDAALIGVFSQTCTICPTRQEFEFSELGVGKIIRS